MADAAMMQSSLPDAVMQQSSLPDAVVRQSSAETKALSLQQQLQQWPADVPQPSAEVLLLLEEAHHRWLKCAQVGQLLLNFKAHGFHASTTPPRVPTAGSLYLFDRSRCRYFRKDGHNWRKKKDGKTVRETHEKLKAGTVDLLNCYYAHSEENQLFQRRSYWLLKEADEEVVLVHYLLVTEKHGAGRMMLGAGGRGRRSTINALPYARLPPAINPVAFAPYAAALPSAINPAFAPYAAAPAALGPATLGSMTAMHRTWADLQQRNGPPQLTHTISDVQHASSALGGGGDSPAYWEFSPHVPSLLSAASSMHSLLLGADSHMGPQLPANSAQLTSLFGLERANSMNSDARQAAAAAAENGAGEGLDSVYAFFQSNPPGQTSTSTNGSTPSATGADPPSAAPSMLDDSVFASLFMGDDLSFDMGQGEVSRSTSARW